MKKMTLDQLRMTFQAGGLTTASIVAEGEKYYVIADTHGGDNVVLVRHSDGGARLFSDPATAIKLLRDVGFLVIKIDMTWGATSSATNSGAG